MTQGLPQGAHQFIGKMGMSTENYMVMAVCPWEQKCPGNEGGRALTQLGWGP